MEKQNGNRQLDVIVNEVVSEAHLNRALLLPEEIDYIRQHALNKPLGVIHIWALGVGVVIAGEDFGWNFGLPVGGPTGVLVASLIVCVLYLGAGSFRTFRRHAFRRRTAGVWAARGGQMVRIPDGLVDVSRVP